MSDDEKKGKKTMNDTKELELKVYPIVICECGMVLFPHETKILKLGKDSSEKEKEINKQALMITIPGHECSMQADESESLRQ